MPRMFTNALEKGHTIEEDYCTCWRDFCAGYYSNSECGQHWQLVSSRDFTGTVPGYCTIASTGSFTVSNGSFAASGKSGNLAIANLGTTGGVVEAVSATGSFQINANETCAVSLVSGSGGLSNLSNTSAKNISYSAVVFDSYSPNQNLIAVPATPRTPFFFIQLPF